MCTLGLIRRMAIAACSAFGLLAAVACQNAVAQSGLPIRNIQIDVTPLRASVGDPTASWVQQGAPDQLARALAGRMTTKGGTLVVRIDYVTLGPIKDSSVEWAPRAGQSGEKELTVEPGFRKKEAHGQAPHAQH